MIISVSQAIFWSDILCIGFVAVLYCWLFNCTFS